MSRDEEFVFPEGAKMLPTGKPHVSFSEYSNWVQCSYRHKLVYVNKLLPDPVSPAMSFGTAVHKGCEIFLKTKTLDLDTPLKMIKEDFDKNCNRPEYIKVKYSASAMEKMLEVAASIMLDVPAFFDKTFPEWEFVAAEQFLYEPLQSPGHYFKGYIDGVIQAPKKPGSDKKITWVVDFKTCPWGWSAEKKQDEVVRSQLMLYKTFWSTKMNVPMKDIRAGFILLKKTGKNGDRCELVPVSVGDVTSERVMKRIETMVKFIDRGFAIKNKQACEYCEFKGTVHCP
jgi:hypothetical protein